MELEKDAMALVVQPTFKKNKWTGAVDITLAVMPQENLTDEDSEILFGIMNELVTCYHLLSTDEDFAEQINTKMKEMYASGDMTADTSVGDFDNVVQLSEWTKTKGNA